MVLCLVHGWSCERGVDEERKKEHQCHMILNINVGGFKVRDSFIFFTLVLVRNYQCTDFLGETLCCRNIKWNKGNRLALLHRSWNLNKKIPINPHEKKLFSPMWLCSSVKIFICGLKGLFFFFFLLCCIFVFHLNLGPGKVSACWSPRLALLMNDWITVVFTGSSSGSARETKEKR